MIAIGSDHGGFALKEEIKKHLDENKIPYEDFGTYNTDSVDYPLIAEKTCAAIATKASSAVAPALVFLWRPIKSRESAQRYAQIISAPNIHVCTMMQTSSAWVGAPLARVLLWNWWTSF